MIDTAISKANFKYATKLRARGYVTVIHALPVEAKKLVDELLEKGENPYSISNQLNQEYGLQIEKMGLKPISNHAIQTYRDNYWKKSIAFARMVMQGDEDTKRRAELIKKDFDAYVHTIEAVKQMRELALIAVDYSKKTATNFTSTNTILNNWFVSA
jgi:hypothetical protein